jgi:hypothetical protein
MSHSEARGHKESIVNAIDRFIFPREKPENHEDILLKYEKTFSELRNPDSPITAEQQTYIYLKHDSCQRASLAQTFDSTLRSFFLVGVSVTSRHKSLRVFGFSSAVK